MKFRTKMYIRTICYVLIGLLLLTLGLAGLVRILSDVEDEKNEGLWNGGVCPECGGTYIYQQAVGHYNATHYIYMCDGCRNLVEVNNYYK